MGGRVVLRFAESPAIGEFIRSAVLHRSVERSQFPTRGTKKPDRSAHMRIVVRLGFGFTEPHQAAALSARDGKPRTRFDVSQQRYSCLGEGYFFFFLPVFFFAFFAFLAILPSGIPKLVEMQVEHLDVQR